MGDSVALVVAHVPVPEPCVIFNPANTDDLWGPPLLAYFSRTVVVHRGFLLEIRIQTDASHDDIGKRKITAVGGFWLCRTGTHCCPVKSGL